MCYTLYYSLPSFTPPSCRHPLAHLLRSLPPAYPLFRRRLQSTGVWDRRSLFGTRSRPGRDTRRSPTIWSFGLHIRDRFFLSGTAPHDSTTRVPNTAPQCRSCLPQGYPSAVFFRLVSFCEHPGCGVSGDSRSEEREHLLSSTPLVVSRKFFGRNKSTR